jgi:hypothetical protein
MEVLKCNAEFNKVYYVKLNGSLHECKFIRTESSSKQAPYYVLNIALMGTIKIQADRFTHFDKWYHNSKIPSILYESVEDFRNNNPIIDEYGSTSNCFNSKFIEPLFTKCSTCNCGGSVYLWRWDGCKAVKYIVNMNNVVWHWDAEGFHCSLNDMRECYRSEKECKDNNEILVVRF